MSVKCGNYTKFVETPSPESENASTFPVFIDDKEVRATPDSFVSIDGIVSTLAFLTHSAPISLTTVFFLILLSALTIGKVSPVLVTLVTGVTTTLISLVTLPTGVGVHEFTFLFLPLLLVLLLLISLTITYFSK